MSLLDSASLIVTPNGYKEGKLYSVIPSDGSGDMSVVRATTATRVNSSGLVELVPYNIAQYSEQFDNAAWVKERITITANITTAPNGSLTADKIVEDNTTNSHRARQNAISEQGVQYTLSFYLKASERTKARITAGGLNAFANFDLSNGTIIGSPTLCTASIISADNGWYRCSITYTQTSATSSAQLHLAATLNAAGDFSYLGDGVSGIFIWGAQLVEGSVAKDYQKTETRLNIPRLDYSNGTCPSLLVEPQRTNLVPYSSAFENAAWTKANATVTANATTAPDGTLSADKLTSSSGSIGTIQQIHNITASQSCTMSIFAKADGFNTIKLNSRTTDGLNDASVTFDLSSGTISIAPVTNGGFSSASGTITDYGNGWYRCTLTHFSSITTATRVRFFSEVTGDGTKGLFLWGGQFETNASYPTSYIPTTSASVTRNADVISKTGISSLIGQTEGTLFVEIFADGIATSARGIMYVSDGTTGNRVAIQYDASGNLQAIASSGGTTQGWVIYGYSGNAKIAFAYNATNYELFVNGVSRGIFVGSLPITLNRLDLGSTISISQMGGIIKATALWKTRLTNDELATLTTI
jgi:YD repeat-containing protein